MSDSNKKKPFLQVVDTDSAPVHIHSGALLILKTERKPYPIQKRLWFGVDLGITIGFQNLSSLNLKPELGGNILFQ